MLKSGIRQGHESDTAKNKPSEKVGVGIYITPHITTAL